MQVTKELEEASKRQQQGASGNKEGAMKSGMKGGNGGSGQGVGGSKDKKAVRIRDPADSEESDGREGDRKQGGLDGRQIATDQQRYLDVITTEDNVSDVLESGYQSTILSEKQSDAIRRRSNDFELSESYL